MRVGVIRGDTPGPLFLSDLEPTSQTNFPVDPAGQTRYVSRPDLTIVGARMAVIPASVESTGDIALPLAVANGVSDVLRVNTGGGMVVATVAPSAGYATMALLIAAVNAALVAAGIDAVAEVGQTALRLRLKTTGALNLGPGATITVDTVANGSTINVGLAFGAGGLTFTVPTVLATIASMLPLTGPLDVSITKMRLVSEALVTAPNTVNAMGVALADAIAPKFVETDVAVKSYQVGTLAGYLSLGYVPDPHRMPAQAAGPAITVVQDDGVTLFSALSVADMPMITNAQANTPNPGDITITGVGMAYTERNETVVDVTDPVTMTKVSLPQKLITSTISDSVLLTGTFSVSNGSDTVGTSLNQTGLLLPGNSIVFSSQPNVLYDVSVVAAASITLTAPYTGIDNPLTLAKTPITQGVVTPVSIVIPSDLLVPVGSTTSLGAAAGALVALRFTQFANGNYGDSLTVASVVSGLVTLTGLAHMTPYSVGQLITISGGAVAGNNGTFRIVSYLSATSVTYMNIYGDATDANNGAASFVWNEIPPVVFVTV